MKNLFKKIHFTLTQPHLSNVHKPNKISMDSGYALMMEPNEVLTFKFIPNTNTTSNIFLKNVSNTNVIYKIKTTAPKSYFVRPNQGILSPGEQKEVSIIMQAIDKNPGATGHKFQIQHSVTSLTSTSQTAEITKFWDSAVKDEKVKSARLSVVILEDGHEDGEKVKGNKGEIKPSEEELESLPVSPPSESERFRQRVDMPQEKGYLWYGIAIALVAFIAIGVLFNNF